MSQTLKVILLCKTFLKTFSTKWGFQRYEEKQQQKFLKFLVLYFYFYYHDYCKTLF